MLKKIILAFLLLSNIAFAQWNRPHTENPEESTIHSAFASQPKTLDPARAYSADESGLIAQIYEPPLQYAYLKRPYELEPLTLTKMPTIIYLDKNNHPLPNNTAPDKIAYTIYDFTIKPGIYYQPHPAFAKNSLPNNLHRLADLKNTATRELTAEDYVYEIKRLASPRVHSPIYGVMSKYIVGFSAFTKTLGGLHQKGYIDLRQYQLSGVTLISRYEYQIKIYGVYPQFLYWLAMPFFAPIPWEADLFYANPKLIAKNITFDWYPIGTGPYLLAENNPNAKIVLEKNPNFHPEYYPGTTQKLPQVEKVVLSLDKESIPRWNKFLEGYYDRSGVSADSFDQVIQIDKNGKPTLTEAMKQKGIHLQTTVNPSIFYIGFNMLDPIVGGYSEKTKKLRQAIAIAIDQEESIQLFMNGRGIPAQSPIPPGIFGYESGPDHINKFIYTWDGKNIKRKSIDTAKQLLAEAGYPNGINPKTHKRLTLRYDTTSNGNPDDKAQLNWMRKQFAKIGIELDIHETDHNRFQDKMRTGQSQLYSWGWLADYPDPENFLFLLYGPNGKVKFNGENASNYANPKVDKLFDEMKNMPNSEKRLEKIRELLNILQEDVPWVWGIHPIDFTLSHSWMTQTPAHGVANNILKYQSMNPMLRKKLQDSWNKPILWPLFLLLGFLIVIAIPLYITYYRRENKSPTKKQG
ncbi:MAG: ABC transporter substrate-binding protein [Coxiellaceae bacterium]|nr:ABC transporter substrate-binding protein [Coxiellaceae bacterium]